MILSEAGVLQPAITLHASKDTLSPSTHINNIILVMSLLSFDSPCEVVGVSEAPEGKPVAFILVRVKTPDNREKYLLKSGEGVSWEVVYLFQQQKNIFCFISEILPHNV